MMVRDTEVGANAAPETSATGRPTANAAAWQMKKQSAFTVGPAPLPSPAANEIVVRNRAVAINAIDWIAQALGDLFFGWIKFPFVFGSDSAGEVIAVGRDVTRFRPGDRVLGHAVGLDKAWNSAAAGSFQLHTVLLEHMASPLPDAMDHAQAAVLPLALSTAAAGLFEPGQLGLTPPRLQPVATGRTVLIWGGSTSVGINAIQLAVAAGYEVIATASPRNFDMLRQLGVAEVFDYRSKTVVADIIAACSRRVMAGALAIGAGSGGPCIDIIAATRGEKVVSLASTPVSFETVPLGRGRLAWLATTMPRLMAATVRLTVKARRRGVRTASIFSTSIASNAVGPMIYVDFLPQALATGRFRASPEPQIHGAGLDHIQSALEAHKRGVSAKKLVVTL